MKHISDLVWSVVGEALRLPPDPNDHDGKQVVREENIAERERRISLINHIDDLRYEVNEIGLRLEECGDGQKPLARESAMRWLERSRLSIESVTRSHSRTPMISVSTKNPTGRNDPRDDFL